MIVSMNVSHFVKIWRVLTILHQLICKGVANFGTQCINWKAYMACDLNFIVKAESFSMSQAVAHWKIDNISQTVLQRDVLTTGY